MVKVAVVSRIAGGAESVEALLTHDPPLRGSVDPRWPFLSDGGSTFASNNTMSFLLRLKGSDDVGADIVLPFYACNVIVGIFL